MKKKYEDGAGEMIGFTAVSFFVVFFIIMLAGFIQLSNSLNEISKAVTAASRAAAVCVTYDDAKEQSKRVAESTVTNSHVDNVSVDLKYIGDTEKWDPGGTVLVTVTADVHTIDPFILSGTRAQNAVITIENSARSGILIPEGYGTYMTYMGWQLITAKSSTQYKLRAKAGQNFDSEGFGIINGRYVIACTTTFGKIGDYIDFQLENGIIIHGIMGDEKSQNDATCNEYGHGNGKNVLEFVVNRDTWYGNHNASGHWHSNPGTSSCHPEWNSRVYKVINLGINYFD